MSSGATDKRAGAQGAWRPSTGLFRRVAPQYRDLGFNPVPIRPGTKSPVPTGWQTGRQEDPLFQLWLDQYPDHGLGLLCGTPLEALLSGGPGLRGQFLIAIDVDTDDLVEPVRHALRVPQSLVCAKRGSKGLTIFARGDADQKNKKIRRREPDGQYKTLVEILAAGSQTVIPPTIHPKTETPYTWVGTELLRVQMCALPELNEAVMSEIAAVCEGRAEHFDLLRGMTGINL